MALTTGHPQIPLGNLNRLRASITIPGFPQLNITASFLGREGVAISWEGDTTTMLPQMTGVVNSPEPFQMMTTEIHLIKSQALAGLYESQRLLNSLIGDFTVTTDATTMPTYLSQNSSIMNVGALRLNGEDAGYVVTLRGTYLINAFLWNVS